MWLLTFTSDQIIYIIDVGSLSLYRPCMKLSNSQVVRTVWAFRLYNTFGSQDTAKHVLKVNTRRR